MKKIILLLICSFFYLEKNAAQNAKINSLMNVLKTTKEDTNKVNTLNFLDKEFMNRGDYEKAKQYASEALLLSAKIKFRKGVANSYIELGLIEWNKGNYQEALKNFDNALAISMELSDKLLIAKCYANTGLINFTLGNYAEALKNYFAALKIAEQLGVKQGIAHCYAGIASVYLSQGSYKEALKNSLAALKLRQETGDKNAIVKSLIAVGITYDDMENHAEALKNYFDALKIQKEIGDEKGISHSYNNIGIIYKKQKNYTAALTNYFASLKIKEEIGDKNGLASSFINIGSVNIKLKKFAEAKKYLDMALALSKEIGSNDEIRDTYDAMVELDSTTGNWKEAFIHHKEYVVYRDSMFNEENTKKIVQVQMNYEFEKKEAAAKAEQDKKDVLVNSEIKRQKLIKNSTLGGVGIAGIFSFLLVRSFNRRRKTSFEKQVSEVEMKALRSQMNPHFIFNSLQSIKKYVLENARNDAAEYLSKFSTLMRLILENSRKQEVSLEKDLSALELYMELESLRFQSKFKYAIEVDPQIDKEDTMIAPLLLQPFVENSIIHGISSKENGMIKIRVNKKDNMIHCTVEDNGIGRDQSVQVETGEKKKRESLGMKITQERLNIINQLKKVKTAVNIFDLKDAENKPGGLRVELLLPFEKQF